VAGNGKKKSKKTAPKRPQGKKPAGQKSQPRQRERKIHVPEPPQPPPLPKPTPVQVVQRQVPGLPRGWKAYEPPEDINNLDDIDPTQGLTVRQCKFVEAMLAGKSPRQAAKAAGYSDSNVHMLDVAASRLMTNVEVARRIRAGRMALRVTKQEVMDLVYAKSLDGMAQFVDVVESPSGEPEYLPSVKRGLENGAGHMLKKLKMDVGPDGVVRTEIETHNNAPFVRIMAEHVGMVRGEQTAQPADDVIAAVAMDREEMIAFLASRGEVIGDVLAPALPQPGTAAPPPLTMKGKREIAGKRKK
jgi:phage terminase small subunit